MQLWGLKDLGVAMLHRILELELSSWQQGLLAANLMLARNVKELPLQEKLKELIGEALEKSQQLPHSWLKKLALETLTDFGRNY